MTEASDVPFGLEITKGIVAKFLLAAIGFVGTIIFARVLGPVAFGGFYLLWSVVQLAKLPVDGFAQAGKKRFSEESTDRPEIVGATLIVIAVVAVAAIVAATFTEGPLTAFTGLENGVLLFVVLFVPFALFSPFQGLVAATGRVSLAIWIDFVRSLFTTPLQLLFVLLGYGAAGMTYGLSLATLCSVFITQATLRTRPERPSRSTLRSLWSYARYSILSVVLGRSYNRLDLILLGLILTPAAAGQYEVALKLTMPAVLVSQVAGDGLMARVSNLDSKGESVAADISHTLSFSSIIALPIFFGSLVLSRPLVVTVYGPKYAAAAPLLVGLAFFKVVRTQSTPLMQALNGLDHPDLNVRISAVTLAVNIVLGVVLTIGLGSIGVVVATVIAETLRYAALTTLVRRWVSVTDLFPYTVFEQLLAAMLMAAVVFGVNLFVPVRSWLHLAVIVTTGAVVYGGVLVAISETLRTTIRSILGDAGIRRNLSG